MRRDVDSKNILDDLCKKFCDVLEKHAEYIVVSGFVAISSGRTRGTEDIDIIMAELGEKDFEKLHKDLTRNGFVCMQSPDPKEIHEYLKEKLSVRYTRKDIVIPEIELKFVKDKLDEYQISHKKKLPLTGMDVWFGSIEGNIAFKEELLKSKKDLDDAKHFRIVYADEIDESEIKKIKSMIRELRL